MSERAEKLKAKLSESNSDESGNELDELYDLIYSAVRRSNGEQWKGQRRFFYNNEDSNNKILEILDDIKVLLKMAIRGE
jgi:hypothetical protein